MKLLDGREIVREEVDEENRLIYIVRDNKNPDNDAGVYAGDVEVKKQLPPPQRSSKTVTNGQ